MGEIRVYNLEVEDKKMFYVGEREFYGQRSWNFRIIEGDVDCFNSIAINVMYKCTQQVIKWWIFKIVSTRTDVTRNVTAITIVQTSFI